MSYKKVAGLPASATIRRRGGGSADLRRAYEHLTRIDILEAALAGPAFCDVSTLAALALEELAAGRDRVAADLLRAAEHICFAAQTPNGYAASTMRVFAELRRALDQEFDTLTRRAELFRQERGARRHGATAPCPTSAAAPSAWRARPTPKMPWVAPWSWPAPPSCWPRSLPEPRTANRTPTPRPSPPDPPLNLEP